MKNIDPQITELCRRVKITTYLYNRGIQMVKRGNRYSCKCPLPNHSDHDPSFYIRELSDGTELFKCFGCLPLSQEVLTPKGMVKAKDIKIGDKVIDVYGKESLIIKVDTHLSNEPFVKLKTTIDNEGFIATADHDMLWLPKPLVNGRRISSRRMADKIYEVEMRHLKKDNWVPVAIPKSGNDIFDIKLSLDKRTIDNNGRIHEFKINKAFAWFCGLYAAEGSISGDRLISIDLHCKETDQMKLLITNALNTSCLLDANVVIQPIREREDKEDSKGQTITICHAGLARWLKTECNTGCENKTMPACFRDATLNIQASWALGVLAGDGNKKDFGIGITSKKLRDEIFRIALMSGAIPSKRKTQYPENKKPVYGMGLKHKSYDSLVFAAENNEFRPRIHKDACHIQIDGNWILAVRIKSLKFFNYDNKSVVDITTDGNHTFSCLTIAVHNCGASGNIITLISAIENEKKNVIVKKISAQAGIILGRIEASARIEPRPDEVEDIFCDEQYAALDIAQIAVRFMQENPTEDAINKISHLYEMIEKFTLLGDDEKIFRYKTMLLDTIEVYC